MSLIKLARLGWRVEIWGGAIDGNLYVTLYSPDGDPSEADHNLLALTDFKAFNEDDANWAIELRLRKFLFAKGL